MLTKTWKEEDQGFFVKFRDMELLDTMVDHVIDTNIPKLDHLLIEYEDVFNMPYGLLPTRTVDH